MFKTKRKRAVVLALIAFFCTAATTYVAVDWKRLGGGFLAYFKGKGGPAVASGGGGGSPSGARVGSLPAANESHPAPVALHVAAADAPRHGGTGGGAGHKGDDDDLFKYGDPAAGGIAPGKFIVAQNENPGGGANPGGAPEPGTSGGPTAPEGAGPGPVGGGESGGTGGSGAAGSPGPNSTGGTGSTGDGGVIATKPPAPPAPSAPPVAPPTPTPPAPGPAPAPTPASNTPAPAPAPSQAGSTSDTGDGDSDSDGSGSTTGTPPSSPGNVSAVPEASNLAMMSLGALFLAVAATRKRKND